MKDIWEMIKARGFNDVVLAAKVENQAYVFARCDSGSSVGLNLAMHIIKNVIEDMMKNGSDPATLKAMLHAAVERIMDSIDEEKEEQNE